MPTFSTRTCYQRQLKLSSIFSPDVRCVISSLTNSYSSPLFADITRLGFKRIHCITFGTPPISLLPIQKPADNRFRKSVFLSIINEGDPVPRADKAYIRSLLNLYSTPSPSPPTPVTKPIQSNPIKPWKRCKAAKRPPAPVSPMASAIWKVPPATLSNAGRLVLLRRLTDCSARSNNHNGHEEESNIVACVTTDEELRGVVFGDPVMHMMKVYARRIKILATNVVLGREL